MSSENESTEEVTDEQAEEILADAVEEMTSEETQEQSEDESDGEAREAESERPVEDIKKDLKDANAEAAKWRTRLREVEKKLDEAKSPEEVEALVAEIKEANEKERLDLLRKNAALEAGLPKAMWGRLQGTTAEELAEDAKSLSELFPSAEEDDAIPGGGLSPSRRATPDFDPKKIVADSRKSQVRVHH